MIVQVAAQKTSSIEKKVFTYLYNNLNSGNLDYLSYCLNMDLDSINFINAKQKLKKISKSRKLANQFYTNERQFFDYNPYTILDIHPFNKPHLLNDENRKQLYTIIMQSPDPKVLSVEELKNKAFTYLYFTLRRELKLKNISYSNEELIRLQNNIHLLVDSGQLAPELQDNFYPDFSIKADDIMTIINPKIYIVCNLFNEIDTKRIASTYDIKKRIPYHCDCTKPINKNNESSDEIFTSADTFPQYKGGDEAMVKFIRDHVKYPTYEKEADIQGKVLVRFIVDKTGRVCNVEVLKKVSPGIDKEAIRLVESLDDFTPGIRNGEKVCTYNNIPINFNLQ